ncbi:MAG: Ig-like domain-containing protein [Prevotella sp.]|nr:Ig-like domain-containing protein [Prevotella sp.]
MLKQLRYFFTFLLLAVANVGWADSWVKTAASDLQTGDIVVIVDETSGTAMSNNNGTSAAPAAVKFDATDVAESIQWEVTVTDDGYQFNVPGEENYLYCTASNNGVRVGSNANNVFTIFDNSGVDFLYNSGTTRYIGVYNSQDWRCYTSINANIRDCVTVFYKYSTEGVTKKTATVTIDATTIEIGEDADVNSDGPDFTLTSSDESIVSINGVTITGVAAGTATITATWEENDEFKGGSKEFTVTVVDPSAPEAGTENNPYTVEQAIAAIDAGTGTEGVYATGIVSKIVTAYNSRYGNISYNISADGTTSGAQLQAYRGFSYNGEQFTSADDIKVGDIVVIYGNLTKYNTTYEFAEGNQLVSLERTDNREPAGLSYNENNFTATIGEPNEFPVLNNPNGLTITYSSTNETVATVDATSGEISLLGVGQTTIKAVFEGNDAYEPGDASYLLVVKEQEIAGTDKFELVTDASTLADGDVIILAYVDEEGKALALSTTQNSNNRAANETTLNEDGTITPGSSIQQITLEDGFYFNVGDGYLYAANSSSNWMRTEAEADDNAKADISIDENGDATIIFQGTNTRNHMRFNYNNGNPVFSCYAESSSIKTLPRIYRKVGYTPTPTLKDAGLAYEVEAYTATIDGENEFPVLANPNELAVTYTSSDESVATVDAEGNITLVGAGETTITATSKETDAFKAGEASYVLTVEEQQVPGVGVQYQLVTSTDDITSGKYLIVSATQDGTNVAFNGSLETLDATFSNKAVEIVNNTITTDEAIYFNIDVENGTLQSASGLYIGVSSNNNGLKQTENAETYTNTFAINEDGQAVVSAVFDGSTMTLRFNYAKDQLRFRYYKSGQQPIYLYKAVGEVEEETIPVTIGSTGYATLYYSEKALEIPEGVTASIVTGVDNTSKKVTFEELDGIIPANTGVVLQGEPKDYEFKVVNVDLTAPDNNMLKGTDEATEITSENNLYILSNGKYGIGFYLDDNNDNHKINNGAHKAYLEVPAGASNAKYFVFGNTEELVSEGDGLVDGINDVNVSESKKEYFNLDGTRANTLRKGIYIVGGKKVVIK